MQGCKWPSIIQNLPLLGLVDRYGVIREPKGDDESASLVNAFSGILSTGGRDATKLLSTRRDTIGEREREREGRRKKEREYK